MPIAKKWSNFNNEIVTEIENAYAVGEGKLRDRLLAHLACGSDPIPGTLYFRYETTRSKLDQCTKI